MKFYSAGAPNPRKVRIFIAEKGIDGIERVDLDVQAGDTRTPDYLKKNSLGHVPILELDDGSIITESVAICRYLEGLHPSPSLFGGSPREQGNVEMWNRRIEIEVMGNVGTVAVHTIPFFATRIKQNPEVAAAAREVVAQKWAWLDQEMADGRPFVAGDAFSMADITGMMVSQLAEFIGVAIPESAGNVSRWNASVRARPSWSA